MKRIPTLNSTEHYCTLNSAFFNLLKSLKITYNISLSRTKIQCSRPEGIAGYRVAFLLPIRAAIYCHCNRHHFRAFAFNYSLQSTVQHS